MLLDVLAEFSDIISSYDVLAIDGSGPHIRVKVRANLTDGSFLNIRQVVLDGAVLKYAYHWESRNGTFISRWDNAPHYPGLATFPHHCHLSADGTEVNASAAGGDLKLILQAIRMTMLGSGL